MTIYINGKEIKTREQALALIDRPDDLKGQIVSAWIASAVKHHFKNEKHFKKAVRNNRKSLESLDKIRRLFRLENYRFSTKAKDWEETLYFEDEASGQTGRLRQQHRKGPLASIDEKPRRHRFLSCARFEAQKNWYKSHKKCDCCPCFYTCEERFESGRHHIDFAYDGKLKWHASRGTVQKTEWTPDKINSVLKDILGI